MMKNIKNQYSQNERDVILSSMTEGVLAVDQNRKLIMINNAGLAYLEVNIDNPVGKSVDTIIQDNNFLSFVNKLFENKEPLKEEIRIKKNTDRFFLVNGTILKGKKPGVLIVLSDITKLKQLEKIRQDFVANVSHELKTPITSIVGFLETIKQSKIPQEKRKSFLKKALKHSNRLNAIIDDLLWLSKIESMEDSDSFDLISQPLLHIINGAVDDIQPMADKNKNTIEVSCDSSIQLLADSQLLREAFINLLENAIKYGEQSTPIIIKTDINKNIAIHFHNRGEVIATKDKEKIFHRFYRIDKSRSRRQGGTGLGLAIVKHIVFVHGGEISVESNAEVGTIFTITLPA